MRISAHGASVFLSGEPILEDLDFDITDRSRIGVIGRNGCGKTTLLRLLSGELSPEPSGSLSVSGSPFIGVLEQTSLEGSRTLIDELRSAYGNLIAMSKRLSVLSSLLEQNQSGELIAEYADLHERFTTEGGFYFEREYESALKKFGFTESDRLRPVSEFSGGQRTKIAFLKLLLSKPDLLLLDEPTNHLDSDSVAWLEEYLRGYKKAFVVVSHDRAFLDKTVENIYEISFGRATRYRGGYSDYIIEKKSRAASEEKRMAEIAREREKIEDFAERFRYKATKAAAVQSRLKRLSKLEDPQSPAREDTRVFHAVCEPEYRSSIDVLTVNNLKIGFDRPLCEVNFELSRGDRLGIIGGNGLGKSTLLKTLTGEIPSLGGDILFGGLVKSGYFDQNLAECRGERTILEDFNSEFPHFGNFKARSALGAFLFGGEEVEKPLSALSGGERVRLALCKLFSKRPNLLLLDEPTNHLDIAGREALEDILSSYEGTLIFVSHDRYFTKKLAQKLLVFKDSGVRFFKEGFSQYEAETKPEEPALPEKPKALSSPEKKRQERTLSPLKLADKRRRELEAAEKRVASLEERLSQIESELQNEQTASDYQRLCELTALLDETKTALSAAMDDWERAANEANG